MRRRTRLTILIVVLIAAGLAAIVLLRSQAPPEPARLLPGAEAFAYVDLKWVRRLNHLGQVPPVPHDPEYDEFIRQTGFQFEQDLDEAAFALHYPGTPEAPGSEMRFTEVFTGRWNSSRVANYLTKLASSVDNYRGVQIFTIPLQGRTLRVAMLAVGTVAASNSDDPRIVRGIIDRSRKLASPFGGPALLRRNYKHVPFGSLAWAIVSNPAHLQSGQLTDVLLPPDYRQLLSGSVLVASVRFLRAIHLRVEAFYQQDGRASQLAEKMGALLTIFHSLQPTIASAGPGDKDVRTFFDSLKIEGDKTRVTLTATVPLDFIKKVFTEPPPEIIAPDSQSAPASPAPATKKRRHELTTPKPPRAQRMPRSF
ncbi:MAG TPA: hypothetical protein VL155_12010 [Terriglobales bacterium]|jgi:hypothetical protein|nr:hypothetical protein [Terriglobales bacterium]